MRQANFSAVRLGLGAAALASLLTGESQAQEVGTAGAVNPKAQAGARVLHIGSSIVFRERVTTTSAGSVQILFVDKTTLNIGPNSNVVIDEFVYNPNAGRGRMTVSLAKGALRVVGGNVTHTDGATVKTPVATVGVRGGTVTIKHDGETRAINHFGTSTVTSALSTVTLSRPEFATTVSGLQVAPSTPERASQAEIAAVVQLLTSKPGQTGGSPTSNAAAARAAAAAGLGQTSAGLPPPDVLQSVQSQTTSLAQPWDPIVQTLWLTIKVDEIIQQAQQQAQQATPPPPPAPPPPPPPPID